jgi:hypothetical protein
MWSFKVSPALCMTFYCRCQAVLLNTAETSRGLDIKLADLELWGEQFNIGSGFSATLNWTSGVLIIQWINVKPLKNSWLVTLS